MTRKVSRALAYRGISFPFPSQMILLRSYISCLLPSVFGMHFKFMTVKDIQEMDKDKTGRLLRDSFSEGLMTNLDRIITDPSTSVGDRLRIFDFVKIFPEHFSKDYHAAPLVQSLLQLLATIMTGEMTRESEMLLPNIFRTIQHLIMHQTTKRFEEVHVEIYKTFELIMLLPDLNSRLTKKDHASIAGLMLVVLNFYSGAAEYFANHGGFLDSLSVCLGTANLGTRFLTRLLNLCIDDGIRLKLLRHIQRVKFVEKFILKELERPEADIQSRVSITLSEFAKDMVIDGRRSNLGLRLLAKDKKVVRAMLNALRMGNENSVDVILNILLRIAKTRLVTQIESDFAFQSLFHSIVHNGMSLPMHASDEKRQLRTGKILQIIILMAQKGSSETVAAHLHRLRKEEIHIPNKDPGFVFTYHGVSFSELMFRLVDLVDSDKEIAMAADAVLDIMKSVKPVKRPEKAETCNEIRPSPSAPARATKMPVVYLQEALRKPAIIQQAAPQIYRPASRLNASVPSHQDKSVTPPQKDELQQLNPHPTEAPNTCCNRIFAAYTEWCLNSNLIPSKPRTF